MTPGVRRSSGAPRHSSKSTPCICTTQQRRRPLRRGLRLRFARISTLPRVALPTPARCRAEGTGAARGRGRACRQRWIISPATCSSASPPSSRATRAVTRGGNRFDSPDVRASRARADGAISDRPLSAAAAADRVSGRPCPRPWPRRRLRRCWSGPPGRPRPPRSTRSRMSCPATGRSSRRPCPCRNRRSGRTPRRASRRRTGSSGSELGECGQAGWRGRRSLEHLGFDAAADAEAALDAQAGYERLFGVEERGRIDVERDAAARARVGGVADREGSARIAEATRASWPRSRTARAESRRSPRGRAR